MLSGTQRLSSLLERKLEKEAGEKNIKITKTRLSTANKNKNRLQKIRSPFGSAHKKIFWLCLIQLAQHIERR